MAKAKQERKPERAEREIGSGGYPYHLLPAAIKLGEAVKAHGGRDVMRQVLSHDLQMADAGFSQLAASAKTYGIVEGTRALSLTQTGREYFYPTDQTSQRKAMLAFFASPAVFKAIIDKYDGSRLPATNILANVLHLQHGVPQSWSGRAASIFIGTAGSVGVIDSAGVLRHTAARHAAGGSQPALEPQIGALSGTASLGFGGSATATATPSLPPAPANPKQPTPTTKANVWTFSEAGGTVNLETSDPLPKALWERLTKYVKMLEPAPVTTTNTEGTNEETAKRDG